VLDARIGILNGLNAAERVLNVANVPERLLNSGQGSVAACT